MREDSRLKIPSLDKLAERLPKAIRGTVLDHVHAVRDLFSQGRLEAARKSPDRAFKLETARSIVETSAALCTTVGFEPIPLADFPILTSVQLTMVAGIAYVAGRDVSAKAAAEFIGALGANLGVALVLREGSRALLKFFPGFGNAISGALAGAGTYALGKAATAYFIEGVSITDARQLFRRQSKAAKRAE
ncbi:MAG: GTPase [Chthoniobacter sp.]|nr:GTPase [Chthoniobacter sp.]